MKWKYIKFLPSLALMTVIFTNIPIQDDGLCPKKEEEENIVG